MTDAELLELTLDVAKLMYPDKDIQVINGTVGVNMVAEFNENLQAHCIDMFDSKQNGGFFFNPLGSDRSNKACLVDVQEAIYIKIGVLNAVNWIKDPEVNTRFNNHAVCWLNLARFIL